MSDAIPVQVERLLQEREWMVRLARSLVHDEHRADDLAQDAWVTAIERPPTRATSVRGWLASVLRSRAVDRAREETSRRAREDAVRVRDLDTAAPDVVAARAEEHRRVLSAILRLPLPSRDAILLRFFEGLEPQEIAARVGEPASTVRSRIQRALETLREDLDRDHGGDDTSWRAAVGALAVPRSPAAPEASAGRGGPVWPRRVLPLAAAAAVFAAAAIAVVASRTTSARAVSPDTVATGDHEVARRPHPERHPDRTTRADPPPWPTPVEENVAKAAEFASVRITVREVSGSPVADAVVRLLQSGEGKPVWRAADVPAVTTDAAGIATLRSRVGTSVRAWVSQRHRAAIGDLIQVTGGVAVRDVTLEDAIDLRGRVTTADGGVPSDATVTVSFGDDVRVEWTVRAGSDGSFEIDGVPASAKAAGLYVEAAAPGFVVAGLGTGGDDEIPAQYELVLRRARTIHGRFVDREGRPVPAVTVGTVGWPSQATSGADGRIAFSGVPLDCARLIVQPDEFAARRVELDAAAGAAVDLGDVVLQPGGAIRGRIVDADRHPVANASLNVRSLAIDDFVRYGGSDAQGRFVLEHIGEGEHELWASSDAVDVDGFSLETHVGGILAGASDLEVVLTAARKVRVRLVGDEDGRALEVDSISLELLAEGASGPEGHGTSVDSARSTFEVVAVHSGLYDVTVRVDGFEPFVAHRVHVAPDRGVEVVARLRRVE